MLNGAVFAADDPTVAVAALADALTTDTPPTLLDVRWRLAGPPGRDDYAAGHLPGAVFVDLDTQLCGPPGADGRHPLPDPAALQTVLRAAGVRAGHPVVIYDDGDAMAGARAWWTLRWAGHRQTWVLDGGYRAWTAAGHPVVTQVPSPPAGDITVRPGGLPVLDAAGAGRLPHDGGLLIDVRAPERYRGEREPVDPVAGHIPGAVNLPTTGHADATGRLCDAATLRDRFTAAGLHPDTPVAAYCGSGVTAAHTVLALHRAGRTDAALYVGSWSEWITDPDRPVQR